MKLTRIIAVAGLLLLGSCGHVADLQPARGRPLPVKPLMARATPTPEELLTIPPYAKPDRVDELMKRSQPRPQDPFDLAPGTGGAAPSLPPGSETAPDQQQPAAQPAPGMPTTPTTPGD